MRRLGLLCGLLLGLLLPASAQDTEIYSQPGRDFRMGVSLYQNAKYAAAKRTFTRVERMLPEDDRYHRSECMYYKALCDVLLYHKNGASALRKFVETYPESNRVNSAYLQLANFEYDYSRYRSAYQYYREVDPDELDDRRGEKDQYFFRLGYSAFMSKEYADAKLYFSRLVDKEGRYQVVASYYYAYILYSEGHYQAALDIFKQIEDDSAFSSIVPFYMLQCYHMLGDSRMVLEMGPELMETASGKRSAEIGRLIGEAYYKEGRYREAIPYLNSFYRNSAVLPDAEGRYILAYSYYRVGNYDSAAVFFQGVLPLNPEDELKQSTLYHLAYCYIRQNKKKFAMDAFAQAAKVSGVNPAVEEDAMYHHAQLAYELGFTPYQASIKVLEDFLERYPNSAYSKRIYSYLVRMYMTTKDYDRALVSLRKIRNRTHELDVAEQRLLFNQAVEAYRRRAYATALDRFTQCAALAYDEKITAKAEFWRGECFFSGKRYAHAMTAYQKFLAFSCAESLPEYGKALFSMGYAAMERVNYPLARQYWQKFLSLDPALSEPRMVAEAWAREGDCQFMMEEYLPAIESYSKAKEKGYRPEDYLLLQTALCQGAAGRYDQKIETLQGLEFSFPESSYKARAWEELASTCLMLDQSEQALQYYRKLRDYQPNSTASLRAWSKMGLIYYNQGKNQEAIDCFKVVVEANPSSEEGRQALVSIRNIYMAMNQVDRFFAYVDQLPNMELAQGEQDSLTYFSAENLYLEEDYVQALQGFKKYLEAYPEGIFMADAWKNVAECARRIGDQQNLKASYAKLSQLKIPEAESSALALARLYYADREYKPALGYFIKAESLASSTGNIVAAKVGKMRCYRGLGQTKELIESALDVLRTDGVTEEESDEARYFIAQAAPAIGERELAMQQYGILAQSKNPDYSSQARYVLLEQRVKGGFYDEAEKMILDYISGASINDYYLAKTYLLWADIYYQKGNVLQAKQTLQSVADNYEGEDIRALALEKLDMIAQKEAQELKTEEELRSARYPEEGEIVLPPM